VGDTAGVHQLDRDASALGVDGVGDLSPAGDVRVGVDSRRQEVALTVFGRLGALGDDQGHGGPLPVVLDIELAEKAVRQGAVTAHGRHDEPVRQFHVTDGDGGPDSHG
jgi:hypothetical protein